MPIVGLDQDGGSDSGIVKVHDEDMSADHGCDKHYFVRVGVGTSDRV